MKFGSAVKEISKAANGDIKLVDSSRTKAEIEEIQRAINNKRNF